MRVCHLRCHSKPIMVEGLDEELWCLTEAYECETDNLFLRTVSNHEHQFITLLLFVVPLPLRRQKLGTQMLNDLKTIADKYQYKIDLSPDSKYGTDLKILSKFYREHGFVWTNDHTMVRLPGQKRIH